MKIIHYRKKCIGCGICFEWQPEIWRMSKKDGKSSMIKAINKKDVFILEVAQSEREKSEAVSKACPVNIIKVL